MDLSADRALETLIDSAFSLMLNASDPDSARTYFAEMARLIAQRSPQAIFAKECERRRLSVSV